MRILILQDLKITNVQIAELTNQYADMFKEATGITPEIYIRRRDFTSYPTEPDSDGDPRPTQEWLRALTREVYDEYKQGVDHVVILVHQDNWRSDPPDPNIGIWGVNWSNIFFNYQVHYCRFDRRNMANSLGTLHHEIAHSFDAFIRTYTGTDINKVLGIKSWDREIVHGEHKDAVYMRHRDNLQWLTYIAPYLKQAYAKRHELYFERVTKPLYKQIISLAEQAIVLLRARANQQNGNPRT
jgi:hypothetical protein